MSVPFRIEPDPPKRPAQQDPFLEFESERAALSGLLKPHDELRPPVLPPALPEPAPNRGASAINPSLAFALGVAGLVTAAVGYYQMTQVLASRSSEPAGQPTTTAVAPVVKPVGRLEITSEPAGASVSVDGLSWGATPLSIREIPSGRHRVVISRGSSSVTREVDLAAGSSALVTAVISATPPDPPPAPARAPAAVSSGAATASGAPSGWITVETPIELRILERGRPRGTTSSGRVSLAEGAHELEFVNALYEIRHTLIATVVGGRGTRVNVPIPAGSLSINAEPWADVWVDGTPIGTTPLANVSVTVGRHEVVLKHPTLGERKQSVIVKAVTPFRLGVTMR